MYDYQTFTEQNYGGISRYFTEIICRIGLDDENSFELASIVSNNYYLKEKNLNKNTFFEKTNFKGKRRLMKLINQNYSKKILLKNDFDVFHPTYYDPYYLNIIKNPYVLTVHDLIYQLVTLKNDKDNKILLNMGKTIKNASHLIAISQNTKNDLMEYYNISEEKISVIYHGNSLIQADDVSNDSKSINNYFLFVGNRSGYKNFNNLVFALSEKMIADNILLVCAGGGKPSLEEAKMLNKLKIKEKVIFYPLIDDDLLINLYKNALGFIFPSKYEGFGIPVLESFACGCPILLSNVSSLPEIAGDSALYFDPNSIESIKHTVSSFLELSNEAKNEMKKKGYDRLKLFSWDKTYKQTISVYEKLI